MLNLNFLVFLVILIALAPIINLVIRTFRGKKIKEKEKNLSVGFSVFSVIFIILVLIYSDLYTESLWFQSLGYESVFWKKNFAQWALFVTFTAATFLFLRLNAFLLERFLAPILKKKHIQKIFGLIANIISGVAAVIVGFISSSQWEKFLMFLNRAESGISDPIFHKDISFYLFNLPVQDYVSNLLLTFSIIFCVIFGISYFVFVRQRTQKFPAWGSIILIEFLLIVIWKLVLARYHLLYGSEAVFYGAGYTDVHVTLVVYKVFIATLIPSIIALVINAFWKNWKVAASVLGMFVLVWMITGVVPGVFWKIKVEPNQLEKEYQYINYNIQSTRQAYGLDQIEEKEFKLDVSFEVLAQNQETLENIRLWDSRALISSYQQRQAFRPYYEFSNINVDRYMVDGKYRQVMLAPRELEQNKLDDRSWTWVNTRLKFTHGYGVVLNVVSEFIIGGAPNFLVADIPPQSRVPEIKVTRPEIYYGLLTRGYVIVKTTEPEFDYPRGDTNIFTFYQGESGVRLGTGLRKLALALKFNDKDILLSEHLKPESQIMFYRQIQERVKTLAPFLRYDSHPYLVIDSEGKLWWMIDAYTVSAKYPYSEPDPGGEINYIRNSVKITVNAYDGRVYFYIFDEKDPVIRTWMNVFPELFRSKDEMPKDLLSHVRYPEDLLYVQAKMYDNYHVIDPQVFYNKEDVWQFGNELYEARGIPSIDYTAGYAADSLSIDTALGVAIPRESSQAFSSGDKEVLPQEILPYFVIIRLPDSPEKEFILMLPFTPRNKDNLIGWIAGRSDGVRYGKVLVFKFSKQTLVYGPMQFEARIDQKPEMSEKFSLWNREGSEVIRGNTLIIPIENTLLYVKSIYIKARQSEMPEIKKIIVAMGDRLEWGDSFSEAIRKIIPSQSQTLDSLIESAQKHFSEYQRLTKEGKPSEAGVELEKLQEDLQGLSDLINKMESEK